MDWFGRIICATWWGPDKEILKPGTRALESIPNPDPAAVACGFWAGEPAYWLLAAVAATVTSFVLYFWMDRQGHRGYDEIPVIVEYGFYVVVAGLFWPVAFPFIMAVFTARLLSHWSKRPSAIGMWLTARVTAYERRKERETLLALNAANIDVDRLAKLMEKERVNAK